ncbi:MAG: hypothetical protein OXU20_00965 [Myxococcales bacterium]|nr:hypothetical protein [Myxococcales bacterium]
MAGECEAWKADRSGEGSADYCTYDEDRAGRLHEARCEAGRCVRPEPGERCPEGQVCRGGACLAGQPEDPQCRDPEVEDSFIPSEVRSVSAFGLQDCCYLSRLPTEADGVLTDRCHTGVASSLNPELVHCGVYEAICGAGGDWHDNVYIPCEHGCRNGACLRTPPSL